MKKRTTEEFHNQVKQLNSNIVCLSDYINNLTKCKFKCLICNKAFERTPKAFIKNPICKYCSLKEKHKQHSIKMKNHKPTNNITLDKFKDKTRDLLNEYNIDYNSYIDRNHKIKVTHKKCNRTFEIVAKNFYTNQKCLCCIEDLRREKISKSQKTSQKCLDYHQRQNKIGKDNFNKIIKDLVKDEYIFLDEYIDTHTPIRVKHNTCNHIYKVSPNHFISKGTRCPFCFRQASNLEKDIYDFIKELSNLIIERNNRAVLYPLELDLYIPEKQVAIEINGTLWHSSKYKDKNYHYNKSKLCEEKGIRLIHIYEYEWNNERQRPILQNIIKNALGINEHKLYARKLDIEVRQSKTMKDFFNKNNIQGFRGGQFAICLVDKITRECYMSYIIGKAFFGKGKYEYEVIRGATKLGYTVIGGASKIWNYFIKTYNPKSCVYYIDYNYFNGNSLKNISNMKFIKTQSSFKNYWVKEGIVKNREPFKNSEIKALYNTGEVFKIYNAGTKVYIYSKETENGD